MSITFFDCFLKVSLNLVKIAFLIKIDFFPNFELEFMDYGDIWIIRVNIVAFEIPTDNLRDFKFD